MADGEEEGHDTDQKQKREKSSFAQYKERMDVFPARHSNINKPFEKCLFPDFPNLDVKTESVIEIVQDESNTNNHNHNNTRVVNENNKINTSLLKTVTVDNKKLEEYDTKHVPKEETSGTPKKRKHVTALHSPVKKKKATECSRSNKKG